MNDAVDLDIAWAEVEAALLEHFYDPDLQAARAFYAAMAAHDLPGQLVWPMMVGSPGSLKTETLAPMDGLANVHLIDSVTPNTFISGRIPEKGQKRGKDGLLERIGDNARMLFPDFSTVLEGNRDKRDDIFAQLRRIYDGKLRREFGTEIANNANTWEGRVTVGVAVTPAVDKYSKVFSSLGDRFVMIRVPRAGGTEAALTASGLDHGAKTATMKRAVHGLFAAMENAPHPTIDKGKQIEIAALSEIIAVCRTPVERDYRDRDQPVLYVPIPESNTRLPQQLVQLAKGSARLDGRNEVNDLDVALAQRVAFNTLTPDRAAAIWNLGTGQKLPVDVSRMTLWRALRDLLELGVVTGGDEVRHTLSEAFQRYWMMAKVQPGLPGFG